jgi:hypothetical protein
MYFFPKPLSYNGFSSKYKDYKLSGKLIWTGQMKFTQTMGTAKG